MSHPTYLETVQSDITNALTAHADPSNPAGTTIALDAALEAVMAVIKAHTEYEYGHLITEGPNAGSVYCRVDTLERAQELALTETVSVEIVRRRRRGDWERF